MTQGTYVKYDPVLQEAPSSSVVRAPGRGFDIRRGLSVFPASRAREKLNIPSLLLAVVATEISFQNSLSISYLFHDQKLNFSYQFSTSHRQ